MIRAYSELNRTAKKEIFQVLQPCFAFEDLLEMELTLAGRTYGYGQDCYICIHLDRVSALIGLQKSDASQWLAPLFWVREDLERDEYNGVYALLKAFWDAVRDQLGAKGVPVRTLDMHPESRNYLSRANYRLGPRVLAGNLTLGDAYDATESGSLAATLERLNTNNAEQYVNLYNKAFAEDAFTERVSEASVRAFLDDQDGIDGERGICRIHDRVIGVWEWSEQAPGIVRLDTVAIDARYRRRGYGSNMLQMLLLRLSRKFENVVLNVLDDNRSAISLYESLGFNFRNESSQWWLPPVTTRSSSRKIRGRKS